MKLPVRICTYDKSLCSFIFDIPFYRWLKRGPYYVKHKFENQMFMDFLLFLFLSYIVWNIDIIKSYRLNLNDSNDERNKLYSDSNRIYYDSMRFTSFSLSFSFLPLPERKLSNFIMRVASPSLPRIYCLSTDKPFLISQKFRSCFFFSIPLSKKRQVPTWLGDLYLRRII